MSDPLQNVRRVCVIRMGGMGDILLATPGVRALYHRLMELHGVAEIDFVVAKGMAPAVEGISYVRRVIEFDKHPDGDGRIKKLVPFLRGIRQQNYDLVLNFQPALKTFSITWASGARRVITFKKDRSKQADGHVRHAIDDYNKELVALGIQSVPDWRMDFTVPPDAHARVASVLAQAGIGANEPVLVVNPAGTRPINRWPSHRFAAFLNRMAEEMPRVRLVLTGGPRDQEIADEILRETTANVLNVANKLSVKELGALLARANVVLTGDTGPLHIASALGRPIVCLSGAADPDRTGPTSPLDLVVINRELSCVPCGDRVCKRGDIACMNQLPVEWVMRAVRQRLSGTVK